MDSLDAGMDGQSDGWVNGLVERNGFIFFTIKYNAVKDQRDETKCKHKINHNWRVETHLTTRESGMGIMKDNDHHRKSCSSKGLYSSLNPF